MSDKFFSRITISEIKFPPGCRAELLEPDPPKRWHRQNQYSIGEQRSDRKHGHPRIKKAGRIKRRVGV